MRDGYVERIVEWADATDAERAETLCNAGVLCAAAADMARWLTRGAHRQRQGRILPDRRRRAGARPKARGWPRCEAPVRELRGINSRAELAAAEAVVQSRLRAAAMEAGVTMTDPASVFLAADTRLAPDVTIGPERGVRPGREGGVGDGDPRLQPSGGLQHRARRDHRPVRARCGPARCSAQACTSAISSS